MKKRCLAALLALVLVLSALPVQAWAAPSPVRYGQSVLTGANVQIYNALKEKITQVANGSLSSSTFQIDVSGMGITSLGETLFGMDNNLIFIALLSDLPYELYWFDKTKGWKCSWSSYASGQVLSLEYQLYAYDEYAVHGANGTVYPNRLDTAKTSAAKACLKTAQDLVDRCAGLSDYDKLRAYRDYLCNNNTYNLRAAEIGSEAAGGGPWQMIYMFDNDPNTNVVCEGYSKAFKYLCDLSAFSNDVACYIVSGITDERHMWNIVRINGQSYLADITNCDPDSGSAEPLDAPFLAGDPNSTANGCTVHLPRYELGGGSYILAHDIRYIYEPTTTGQLYSADILKLSDTSYSPSAPDFTDLPDWCAQQAQWAAEQGIAKGTGDGRFSPDAPCTQEQILTFLWRAAGRQSPAATAPMAVSADYADAVNWAYGGGMIDSSFDPKAPCTRSAAVTYIWLALGGLEPGGSAAFTDVSEDDPSAAAVAWAAETGVSDGYANGDGTFRFQPGKVCSRGEIVTLLYRAFV